jgi:hypothetical protein
MHARVRPDLMQDAQVCLTALLPSCKFLAESDIKERCACSYKRWTSYRRYGVKNVMQKESIFIVISVEWDQLQQGRTGDCQVAARSRSGFSF